MSAFEFLYVKQRRTMHSPLPIGQCRERLTYGERPSGSHLTVPSPFTASWSNDAVVRLGTARSSQIVRVRLTAEASGTAADATLEMNPRLLLLMLPFLAVFGLVGYAETSYLVQHGTNLLQAMFPFGYFELVLLVVLVQLRFGGGVEGNLLMLQLERVLGDAAEYHLPAPPSIKRPLPLWQRPKDPIPSGPAVDAPRLHRPRVPMMRMGHPFTLFTTLPVNECARRLGPTTPHASEFGVEWTAANEVVVRRTMLRILHFRYELRAKLEATPGGTRIDAVTRAVPDVLPALVGVLLSLFGLVGYAISHGGRWPSVTFVGAVPFTFAFGWWVSGVVRMAARRVLVKGIVDDMVTSFEDTLEAVPAVPDLVT